MVGNLWLPCPCLLINQPLIVTKCSCGRSFWKSWYQVLISSTYMEICQIKLCQIWQIPSLQNANEISSTAESDFAWWIFGGDHPWPWPTLPDFLNLIDSVGELSETYCQVVSMTISPWGSVKIWGVLSSSISKLPHIHLWEIEFSHPTKMVGY